MENAENMEAQSRPHKFSENYEQRKLQLIATYADTGAQNAQGASKQPSVKKQIHRKWKFAFAAAAVLVALPLTAWAAGNYTDFLNGAFGNTNRENIERHDEVIDFKDGKPISVTFPSREFTQVDEGLAEHLLGNSIADEPVTIPLDDHIMTVLYTVRDDRCAVIHYTLEREGGVTALIWNELSNQGKGAFQSPNNASRWGYVSDSDPQTLTSHAEIAANTSAENGEAEMKNESEKTATADGIEAQEYTCSGSFLYVEPKESTESKLSCYEYIVFIEKPADDAKLQLAVLDDHEDVSLFDLPTGNKTAAKRFISADGIEAEVSPLSINIVGGKLDEDPWNYKKIEIALKDGSTYLVWDHDVEMDNTAYTLGGENGTCIMFNRLVDAEEVASVTINEMTLS